jgi:hypothetical protein
MSMLFFVADRKSAVTIRYGGYGGMTPRSSPTGCITERRDAEVVPYDWWEGTEAHAYGQWNETEVLNDTEVVHYRK